MGIYAYGGGSKGKYRKKTLPVKRFDPNPWGLYQVHGNVWEWGEDEWHDGYKAKPDELKRNGSAWAAEKTKGSRRVLCGGCWDNGPQYLRSANRIRNTTDCRYYDLGFRVARTLNP